jgi:hypothetical protein
MKVFATMRESLRLVSNIMGFMVPARNFAILAVAMWIGFIPQSFGSAIILHLGPPSLGGGGTNPLSIPPQVMDTEFVYLTDGNREISIGLVPGLLYGARFGERKGVYVSGGAGFLFNPDLATVGIYSAFGYTSECNSWCFNIEYKQSLGFYAGRLVTPYAVRAGAGYQF